MPFLEIQNEDGTVRQYWQIGKYFYRQYSNEKNAKRISEEEYMSAYEEVYEY